MRDELTPQDEMLLQFNRLINELLRGQITRNCFQPWELELMLDIEGCSLGSTGKRELLRRYQKAVQAHIERGNDQVFKLSEYLTGQHRRRAASPPSMG